MFAEEHEAESTLHFHYKTGELYIDRKFQIMDELLYPSLEYEQLFAVTEEKATESELFDAQNYGDIFRIKGTEPPLLFKKIELECFDDLESVLNEQYGLRIFDPNCQVQEAHDLTVSISKVVDFQSGSFST